MSLLFVSSPGRLVAIRSDHPRGLLFNLGSVQSTGVVTRVSVDQSVAAQFQPSLDRAIYATPFGDNIGTMTVSLLLNPSCTNGDRTDTFIANYQSTRFRPEHTTPADLIIGGKAFTGFVIAFTLDASADQGHMVQGTMKFVAWLAL